MPVPNSTPGFQIHRYKDVYGITQTNQNSPVAKVDDLIEDLDAGITYLVTAVSLAGIPTIEPWRDISGWDGLSLNKHPSQLSFLDVDGCPELSVYYYDNGSKTVLTAIPDKRVKLRNSELSHYRIFLGYDVSHATGVVISGNPDSGVFTDVGDCHPDAPAISYQGNIRRCLINYELLDNEIVTVVYYDNTNNILAIVPMAVKNKGAYLVNHQERIALEIISPYVSDSDSHVLDCRHYSVIDPADFGVRAHYSNGETVDFQANNPNYSMPGLKPFLDNIAGNIATVAVRSSDYGLVQTYTALRGGVVDDIIDTPEISEFEWILSPFDVLSNRSILNGNNRPKSITGPLVLYPRGNWNVNHRPNSMLINGTYFGGTNNGSLGEAVVFDRAGNVISYNQTREYVLGSGGGANQFAVRLNLHYVTNQDIGGIALKKEGSDMTVNSISLSGAWDKPYVQFGIMAAGSVLNYIDNTSIDNAVNRNTGHKRSVNNEKSIAAINVLSATGGLPYHWPFPLTVNGVGVGNWFIPYYSTPVIENQGMEYLGRDIVLSDNRYAIEVVMKITGDFTMNPGVVAANQAPQSNSIVNVRPVVGGSGSAQSPKYKDYSLGHTGRTFTADTISQSRITVVESATSINGAYLEFIDKNPDDLGVHVTLNNSADLNMLGDITIEWRARVHNQALDTSGVFMDKHDSEDYIDGFAIYFADGWYTFNSFIDTNNTTDGPLNIETHLSTTTNEWHDIAMVLHASGRAVTYVNGVLDNDVSYPPELAVRTASAANLTIGAALIKNIDGQGNVTYGATGSVPFDIDYVRVTEGILYNTPTYVLPDTAALIADETNPNVKLLMRWYPAVVGSGGDPYMSIRVGDNELRVHTESNKVAWINALEGHSVISSTGILNIIRNVNPEAINIITIVRNGADAKLIVNGVVVWSGSAMDYDEDTGPQRVTVDWRDTTRYGPVPYLRSLMVFNDDRMITSALTTTLITPMNQGYLDSPDAIRMEGITQQPSSYVQRWLSSSVPTDYLQATTTFEGDAIDGTYPNI